MCFSHIDADGNAVMVDVTEKAATHRRAVAAGSIRMNEEAFAAVRDKTARKGDVLGVAQVAGIMATKETSRLIPLCHGLGLTASGLKFFLHPESSEIEAVCTAGRDADRQSAGERQGRGREPGLFSGGAAPWSGGTPGRGRGLWREPVGGLNQIDRRAAGA